VIAVVGLSHKNAPLEVRERLALPKDTLPQVLERLLSEPAIGEAVILSTCNRVEVYVAPRPPREGASARGFDGAQVAEAQRIVRDLLLGYGDVLAPYLVSAEGDDAVRHLFRVASSLDSLVVGEPQILGQLKDAIELAKETRAIGATLGQAMHHAVRVGKRVRTDTAIGAGQVSISSVAVDLARQIFGDLSGHRALLVGAGEMAEAASKLVVRGGAKLVVVNRSPERAAALAHEVGGEPRPWAELEAAVVEADIVICSTSSPTFVLSRDLVKRATKVRRGRSLFLIDIAVPRDVDPAVNELDNVYVYDIDDLSQIVAESMQGRAAEAARAEAIVEGEVRSFEAWARKHALTPLITSLRTRTRAVLEGELERSLNGKLRHLPEADREALRTMLDAATNKLLHAPTAHLKALADDSRGEDYAEALRDLFELEEDAISGRAAARGGDGTAHVEGRGEGPGGGDRAVAARSALGASTR